MSCGVIADKEEDHSRWLLCSREGSLHFLPLLICCWQLFSHLWRVRAPRLCNSCMVWFVRSQINNRPCLEKHACEMMMDTSHKHTCEQNEQANAGMRSNDALCTLQLCVCVCAPSSLLSTLSLLCCGCDSRQRGHSCGAGGPLYPQTGARRHKENKPGKMPDQHGWTVGEFNKSPRLTVCTGFTIGSSRGWNECNHHSV